MDMREYYDNAHTYHYSVSGGVEASARLDRWYVSDPLVSWVAAVEVSHHVTPADHSEVRLYLRNPSYPIRVRKPARVYPPPPLALDAVKEAMQVRLERFLVEMPDGKLDADEWACAMDRMKVSMRKETLRIIKQRRKAARASYKQRIRRLLKQERRLRQAAAGQPPTVESITDSLDVLTLVPGKGGRR
ncbi:hypothetical protein PF002_g7997 [Phytophthora fragariae]|uniref:Endonuclease/exonuclease/phosphatase domain-containing protein n=1 Tax=Phytophthora fragariae TaxID=53985 RepID=A0A6A3FLE5_9STRA|nr:hypothetical protein PF003_g35805 [Phytophthora fragariae]KAE8945111.1 hypothetical protein PF009_g5253 [Phytophthora fragariae]KAE9151171.1 hypothetical protein PF006_g4517 [Phytophthora fragariae]KAE9244024.1 hypothetical protein PF002_g7997 [Phytophthora fragariae]